jgi:hypothetical protein
MVFSSFYEMSNPLTTVRKQHFWDWFSGDDLNSRWTKNNITGTGTFAMADESDGGFSLKCGATNGNNSAIDFNNKRQYSHTASTMIAVVKRVTDTNNNTYCGLANDRDKPAPNDSTAYRDATSITYKSLQSRDTAGTQDTTASTVAVDTAWTSVKIECLASSNKMYIAGVEEVDKTANIPAKVMQPFVNLTSIGSGAKEMRIRYYEAYNT